MYHDIIGHDNSILNVKRVQLTNDAANSKDAVRKSQAELISATAVQAALVNASANASDTTTFTSLYTQNSLNSKQDNLSVDSNYFTLVNNTLGFKDLGIVKPYKDVTHTTLAEFIAAATFNGNGTISIGGETLDKMTFIFLDNATLPSEKSFVYLGTNHANLNDFVTFSIDYNEGAIRSFFSGSGVGLNYTLGTGQFSLDLGTTTNKLGAQTLPIDQAEFNTVTGTNVLAILKSLESYAAQIDTAATSGQATANIRLDALSGVTGNTLGTFTGSIFNDNQNIKQILQHIEVQLGSLLSGDTAIRNEFAIADTALQTNINNETTARTNADTTLQNNIDSEASTRNLADANLQTNLTNEALTRSSADTALSDRLDIIEGTESGSILKAKQEAEAYTDTRETAIMSLVNANTSSIQSINNSNMPLIGFVGTDGKITTTLVNDARNGSDFTSIAMSVGDVVVFKGQVTLLGTTFNTNDKLMATETISSGAMTLAKFVHTVEKESDLTKANLGSNTVVLDGSGNLSVAADSINRTQLDSSVESDIDDKFSKTSDNQTISGKSIFIDQSDSNKGSSYGMYLKKTQTGSGALTGTCRGLLVENWINSNGSANPAIPCLANNTITSHYDGNCTDLSLIMSGLYSEANAKNGTAITAIGSWSVATDSQLGVNIGTFAMAENAAISNIAMLGYAKASGINADRGIVAALTTQDLTTFNATRTADPYPYDDIALVADAKYAGADSKALYVYGDSVIEGGSLTIPTPTDTTHAVNIAYLESKQDDVTFDLSSGTATITTALDLSKLKALSSSEFKHNASNISIAYTVDVVNSSITFTATGTGVSDLTEVTVYLEERLKTARVV